MLTVACVAVGTKYGPEYVAILRAMVERNLTVPHRFQVISRPPQRKENDPCWSKLWLFDVETPVLYFDLDVVICGNIDHLVNWSTHLKAMRDPRDHRPSGRMKLNSSVMSWNGITDGIDRIINRHRDENPIGKPNGPYRGDQEFIEECVEIWEPMEGVYSYKAYRPTFQFPPDTSVLIMHGRPKPHELLHVPLVRDHWRV